MTTCPQYFFLLHLSSSGTRVIPPPRLVTGIRKVHEIEAPQLSCGGHHSLGIQYTSLSSLDDVGST